MEGAFDGEMHDLPDEEDLNEYEEDINEDEEQKDQDEEEELDRGEFTKIAFHMCY